MGPRARARHAATALIDFASVESTQYKLLGWSKPALSPYGIDAHRTGFSKTCDHPAGSSGVEPARNSCKTMLTNFGLRVKDVRTVHRGEILVPVERSCDLHLVLRFANPTLIEITINGFSARGAGSDASFVIPRSSVLSGINILAIEDLAGVIVPTTKVRALAIESKCDDR